MLTPTVQQRTTARLLRRALEAALPPPTQKQTSSRRLVDAVADRVLKALEPRRDATLTLTEAEAEREELGRDRRRYFDPCIMRFNPYEELFVFRRVVTRPWDKVWKKSPLVLHDVDLVHAFPFPPYLAAEPYDHVENVTKILMNHPGPVGCLRVDSSLFPPPEVLGRWMDLLSVRGVKELVMLDVATASAAVAPLEFPLRRMQSPALSTLTLGFVQVTFGSCFGFSELEKVCLVCCECSATDLSDAVEKLGKLTSLKIFGVDLGAAGAGAGARDGGGLEIVSGSLSCLELMGCKASGLTVRHAPSLELLAAGVVSSVVKNPRVRWPRMAKASPPLRIKLMQAEGLEVINSLALWEQRISVPGGPLSKVHTVQAALHMRMSQQWRQLLDVVTQLPVLRCLKLTREDDCCADEEVELQPVPACFGDSLRHLLLNGYRAGGAEVALVTKVLATAPHLVSVSLYPHKSMEDPAFAHHQFLGSPRLSTAARIHSCQSFEELCQSFE